MHIHLTVCGTNHASIDQFSTICGTSDNRSSHTHAHARTHTHTRAHMHAQCTEEVERALKSSIDFGPPPPRIQATHEIIFGDRQVPVGTEP